MATETTKLELLKPASGDRVDVTQHVSNNFTTLDTRINALVCTSGTHPSTPYVGMLIYETDTGYVRVYHTEGLNNYWLAIGKNSWGKGYIASTAITADSANTSGTTELDTGFEVSFTAAADRQYAINYTCYCRMTTDDATIGGRVLVRLRWAAGASVTTTDTLLDSASDNCTVQANNQVRQINSQRIFTPGIDGQVTVGLFLVGAASHVWHILGNATTNRGHITIVDVGSV